VEIFGIGDQLPPLPFWLRPAVRKMHVGKNGQENNWIAPEN